MLRKFSRHSDGIAYNFCRLWPATRAMRIPLPPGADEVCSGSANSANKTADGAHILAPNTLSAHDIEMEFPPASFIRRPVSIT
jgi:hypothetical protein